MELTVSTRDVSVTSPLYMPDPVLADEAHRRMKLILHLGEEMDARYQVQIEQLKWFHEDPERIRAAGFDSLLDMLKNPDIANALWGRSINSRADVYRFQRMVLMQIAFKPEEGINVFTMISRSVTQTGMMSLLEQKVAALPAPDAPEREQAVQAFALELQTVGQRTYRENVEAAKPALHNVFTYDQKSGTVFFTNGSGPKAVLKLNPQAGPVAAEVLSRIVPSTISNLTLGPDELTAWVGHEPITVGVVLTTEEHPLNALATVTHAMRE